MASGDCDYIVVGGGSSGCAVAARLADAGKRVLLLEAGPRDNHPFVHMPATFARVIGSRRSWLYQTEPQPHAAGRRMTVPQGRTLGGGSAINAMVYIRGHASDYDGWRDAGCPGWGWDDVLPVFRRIEANQRLSAPWHGVEGPLSVSDARFRHPLSLAFVKAAQETGLAYNHDFNGASQLGTGFYQTTTHAGQRASSAVCYLAPRRANRQLIVRTDSFATRVLFDGDNRATGVEYLQDGRIETARARAEVILAAGALATPKLLMLSGIGPAAELARHGIAVRVQAAHVGRNYQDHLEVPVYGRTRRPTSLLGEDRGVRALRNGAEYLLFRQGLLTSNVVESGAFVDLDGDGIADVQFHVLPVLVGDVGRDPPPGHGITLNPCGLHPRSRGSVRLRSADPTDPIRFDSGSLTHPYDVDTLVAGVQLARRILRAPSLAAVLDGELLPSPAEHAERALLEEHVRAHAKTVYHPSCTCRMGQDEDAVVDPQLRVRGTRHLRICDASVMPRIPTGNTNAAAILLGERCADFILG